ncbi:cut8 domain protein [Rhizoctonia solani]|uniref:Cut8 domain protein n=1 Tax=Rhizoctonia solani TaxID=456999 RepID=A0A8H8P8M9_9AGAM|nr:cut8 domain protein [Rhizoctonia solani]QRW27215.1 cut8 domain protein [Rhizoctonia solani]
MSAPHLLPQQPIHVPFRSAPVTHAPSPFGFGFGLSSQPSTSSIPPHYNGLSPFGQHSSHQHGGPIPSSPFANLHSTSARPVASSAPRSNAKRRYDDSVDPDGREDSNMATRSPSPDRLSAESQDAQANIDVGVLLVTPPALTSLISSQPNLKPLVISLIPQPSVQVAIQALDASAKVIRDTYPYSQTTQPTSSTSTSFGFGSSFGAPASMHAPASTSFGFRTNSQPSGPMREDYIRSRIRPSPAPLAPSTSPKFTRASLHDSFAYLCALTVHIMRAPPLARALLLDNSILFPKLIHEWSAWVDCLDVEVNQNGGMFSAEAVREWERSLDE